MADSSDATCANEMKIHEECSWQSAKAVGKALPAAEKLNLGAKCRLRQQAGRQAVVTAPLLLEKIAMRIHSESEAKIDSHLPSCRQAYCLQLPVVF